MAANICSDENYSNTVVHSPQEDKSISIGLETELSELHIPTVEISSPSEGKTSRIFLRRSEEGAGQVLGAD